MIQVIYVTSPESQQIYVWKLNQQFEKLDLIQIVSTPGQAQPIAIHPTKKFLYVGVRPDYTIITYSINTFGLLKYLGKVKVFSSPTYLASNIRGTFLYCASYQYNSISVLPITMSGILNSPIQIIEDLIGCHAIGIDPHKELLWVPCLKEDSIRLFKEDTCGKLITFNPHLIKSDVFTGPRHIIFHGMDCYAYIINELNSTVSVINYNFFYNNKTLDRIEQTLNIIPKDRIIHNTSIKYWGSDIHMTPNGHWLYCSDRAANIISYFKIFNETRLLRFIGCKYTETQPRGFAIDTIGKFLIVAGQKSHHISLYRINLNNGELINLSRYHVGKGPIWISIIALN